MHTGFRENKGQDAMIKNFPVKYYLAKEFNNNIADTLREYVSSEKNVCCDVDDF